MSLSDQNRALIERENLRAEVLAIFKANKMATDERLAILIAERLSSRLSPPAPEPGDKANHDCLAKRRPGEPMFILLGRDPDAHNIVRSWAERRLAAGGDPEHCQMGLDTAERMRLYAADPANAPASAPPASAYPALSPPASEPGYEAEPVAYIRPSDLAELGRISELAQWVFGRPDEVYSQPLYASPVPVSREEISRTIYDFLEERFPGGCLPGGVQLFADDELDADFKHEAGCDALADAILQRLSNQQGGES